MKFIKLFAALYFAIIFTACVPLRPPMQPLKLPPERLAQKGYFLMPLNEEGWSIAHRNLYQLVLLKNGENADETIAIQAMPFELSEYKTKEELRDIVKKGQESDSDQSRFEVIKHEVEIFPKNEVDCIKSHMVTKDNAAVKQSGNPESMILEALTLTCAHPKDKSVGINVTYSQRYYAEQKTPGFQDNGMKVLESLNFTEF